MSTPDLLVDVKNDWTWVKTHLVLLMMVALLSFGAVYGIESFISKHDAAEATKYSQIATTQNQQTAQVLAQVQTEVAALMAANQQLANQNQQLVTSLSKRQTTEVQIPKQTASLTAAQVAIELQGTANGDNVTLALPVAQNVLANVKLVPLLQQDKTDLQSAYNNQVQVSANNLALYNDEHLALVSEQKAHQADNTANAATIKKLKADARKGKLKWFFIGFVSGFITRVVTVQ